MRDGFGAPNSSGGNALVFGATDFTDSVDSTVLTISGMSIIRANALSSVRLSVGAGCRCLTVFVAENSYGTTETSLPIYVDGTYVSALTPTANCFQAFQFPLDGRAHTVEIVGSWQQYGTGGAFLHSVSSEGGQIAILPNPSVARRLVVFGDSIANGASATSTSRLGWLGLLRTTFSGRIALDGWGGQNLYSAGTPAEIAARLVALLFDSTRREIWDEMGYNDFNDGPFVNVGLYQAQLAALYDAVHAADPTVRIYCQTQLITPNEAALNPRGETIPQFRAAKIAAAAGRSWVTVVDGLALIASMAGVHPNSLEHATIKGNIAAILG